MKYICVQQYFLLRCCISKFHVGMIKSLSHYIQLFWWPFFSKAYKHPNTACQKKKMLIDPLFLVLSIEDR